MTELFEALYGMYNLSNPLFSYKKEDGQEMPYAVYQMVSDVPQYTFDTVHEEFNVQFNLYSDSNSQAEVSTFFNQLKSLYDDCKLSVDGYRSVRMERTLALLVNDLKRNAWQYTVQYRILLERN